MIRVAVTGATGKMTQAVIHAVLAEPDMELAGAVSRQPGATELAVPGGTIPWRADLGQLLDEHPADVVVDFSNAATAMGYVQSALDRRVPIVIGTSGLTQPQWDEVRERAARAGVGAVIAPNFAVGAVLMMHLSKVAAPFFDYAEITELHHEQKADSPSGTAIATAQLMAAARREPFRRPMPERETFLGARGAEVEGVTIHAVRMPGLVASQEVRFGTLGQTLLIRHDSISRESFMPGVILAIRAVTSRAQFYAGLEGLLGLTTEQGE